MMDADHAIEVSTRLETAILALQSALKHCESPEPLRPFLFLGLRFLVGAALNSARDAQTLCSKAISS